MTVAELEEIARQATALGAKPDLLMMSRNTAVECCGGDIDLTPLEKFAKRHGCKFALNEKCPRGVIFFTEEGWNGNEADEEAVSQAE